MSEDSRRQDDAGEGILSKNELRVTERIRKFLWKFPNSSPKEICRMLDLPYKDYRNMVSVEKSNLKRWMGTKVLGRLPKPLLSAHRVEWSLEKPLSMPVLLALSDVANRRRPRLNESRPVDEWYVIPNRNSLREFHNEHVTVRVFPKSGTVRVLLGREMDFATLQRHVKIAFLKAGLPDKMAESESRLLIPANKHRTFKIGTVTPFKVDFYKDSLGLTILADSSHPEHLEVIESYPSWIRPLLLAVSEQTKANERQTEAITLLTEQIRVHLSVMQGIDKSTKLNAEASEKLATVVNRLYREVVSESREKSKPFSLKEWLREVAKRQKERNGKE